MEHGVHCDRISNNDRLFRVSNRNEQRKSAFPLMHACSASSYLRIVYSKGKIIARNLMALNRIVIWCGIHFRRPPRGIKGKGVRVNCAKANKAEASPGTSHSMYPATHSISQG